MTTIVVDWHAVAMAFTWGCLGFTAGLLTITIVDEVSRRRRYVKELESFLKRRRDS